MRSACVAGLLGLLGVLALAACSSTSAPAPAPAQPGAEAGSPIDTDGGATADAAPDVVPGFPDNHGPGAYGALPSGYCCTKDSECVGRQCLDVGSGERMCLDPCSDESFCDVPSTPFGCKQLGGNAFKTCSPPAGTQCLPAGDFVRGTRATGDCCASAPGQAGGAECASHVCGSFGDGNPDMCMIRCAGPADCPPDYKCETNGGAPGWVPTCLPFAVYSGGTYTCK